MECISIFDMLKIGVGPSSSHTLGPWRAAERWIKELKEKNRFDKVEHITVDLYGSLSLTGKGHATDYAVLLGLSGADPEYIPVESIDGIISIIKDTNTLNFNDERGLPFNIKEQIIFNRKFLPFHANGMSFTALINGRNYKQTYYSIGGGFVVQEERKISKANKIIFYCTFPYPISYGDELLKFCHQLKLPISGVVLDFELKRVWNTMLECMYVGCHTEGNLPGGLNVRRRAYDMHKNLIGENKYENPKKWLETIRTTEVKFRQILKWVSCFALAVNEVNAKQLTHFKMLLLVV